MFHNTKRILSYSVLGIILSYYSSSASDLKVFSANLAMDADSFEAQKYPRIMRGTWEKYQEDRVTFFLDGTLRVLTPETLGKNWEDLSDEDKAGVSARDLYQSGDSSYNLPSREGMEALNAVGVNQFTKDQLQKVVAWVRKTKPGAPITIVDHREEPHGHFEGYRVTSMRNGQREVSEQKTSLPISMYGLGDAFNQGKNLFELEEVEGKFIDIVANHDVINVANLVVKTKGVPKSLEVGYYQVADVYNEGFLARQLGLGYARIGITDFSVFESDDGSHFQLMGDALPPETVRIYHCRGGKGRTTTGMTIHDIMTNGVKLKATLTLHDMLLRQYLIGGSHLLNPVSENDETGWKQELAFKRAKGIYDFYQYTLANSGKTRGFYHRQVKK